MNLALWITAIATGIYATVATITLIFIARGYNRQIKATIPIIGFESSPEKSIDCESSIKGGIRRITLRIKNVGQGPAINIQAICKMDTETVSPSNINISGLKDFMAAGDTTEILFQWLLPKRIPENFEGYLYLKIYFSSIHEDYFVFTVYSAVHKGRILDYLIARIERLEEQYQYTYPTTF